VPDGTIVNSTASGKSGVMCLLLSVGQSPEYLLLNAGQSPKYLLLSVGQSRII